jgi:hypothetical protein
MTNWVKNRGSRKPKDEKKVFKLNSRSKGNVASLQRKKSSSRVKSGANKVANGVKSGVKSAIGKVKSVGRKLKLAFRGKKP